MALITYDDKDNSLPNSNPRKLWRDSDANEAKNVVNTNYVEQTKIVRSAVASGTNSYAATVMPAPAASYGDADQQRFQIKFGNASSGNATLNLNTLGAKKIFKNPTTQAGNGDIPAGQIVNLVYDAALDSAAGGFLMMGAPAAASGGAVDSVNGQTGVVVLDAGDVGADPAGSASTVAGNLSAHISDTTDAHAASAITNTPAGNISATTVQNAINELDTEKAPLASPTFTGNPTAPTPSAGDNDTSIATTAFVNGAIDSRFVEHFACSDETTFLTTGTGKLSFRMKSAGTLVAVRISLVAAQTSGSIFTVDINKNGTTVLSTKLTIDNNEKTSVTAATPAVISVTSFADDDEVTIDIDQTSGTAAGLKGKMYFA